MPGGIEMPTWKKKDTSGEVRFYHVCGECNKRLATSLEQENWQLLREGEPVSCNECSLNCRLIAEALWGESDDVRYAVCNECPDLDNCALKGRYYC